ncbi:MAG: hypothetical protein HY898_29245 [Deltaproteobacteria bacterium]|nr:hypothetical protein [Deltaproteobacteria bacterium]
MTLATIVGARLLWAPVTAVLGTMVSEIFSTRVRYTGVTLGYQLGAAIAGGTAPLVATALLRAWNNPWVPVAMYIIACGCVSLASVALTRKTKGAEPA